MARPKKPAGMRKEELITIPVTADQKRLIMEAGDGANPNGYTPWARDLLLREAAKTLRRRKAGDERQPETTD